MVLPISPDEKFTPVRLESPLSLFLTKHNDNHGLFLSHLDESPVETKKVAFFSAMGVHSFYLAIFLWRAYIVYAYYGSFSKLYSQLSVFGVVWLCLDLYIIKSMGLAFRKFARNSLWYRLRCGFRPIEIVIRRPHPLYQHQLEKTSIAEGSRLLHDELHRAMDASVFKERPGDAMQTPGIWLVDYGACDEAYHLARLLGPGAIEEAAWRASLWTWDASRIQPCWMCFESWKEFEPARCDRYMQLFKEELEYLGKGELYDGWLNLLYVSGTTSSGTSIPINMNMVDEQVAYFKREGIDFMQFITDIGVKIDEEFYSPNRPIGF